VQTRFGVVLTESLRLRVGWLAVSLAALVATNACVLKRSGKETSPPGSGAESAGASAEEDQAALGKIDRVLNDLYLAHQPDEAEAKLISIIQSCEGACSAGVRARGWMYVGIVRGSGKDDQEGARDAFERAIKESPQVEVDRALATPATIATFHSVKGND